jgi:alanyl-tRNA synthetase
VASERKYYDDSYTRRFTARVIEAGAHAGRPAVALEATYFYPESGGQEADRGRIGAAAVLDVQADDGGPVWHVLGEAAPAAGSEIEAEIDWARRFDNMQQHTGQHILSAAFERVLNAATVSSHLGEEKSSIEVARGDMDWNTVANLEAAANEIVWRDLAVERHWVDESEIGRWKLRKPPVARGRIRIVEIPEWDLSACGGTHTQRTGEVGIIKIVRWEKVRGNLRFEFLCGGRALRDYAWRAESLLEAARRRTLSERELIAHLERAATERDDLKRQLRDVTAKILAAEARERVGDPPRGVTEHRPTWSREDARTFAIQCLAAGAPWVCASAGAPEPVLVAARPRASGVDLKSLLPELLERTGGKGGGSPDFLQIAPADGARAEAACRWISERLLAGA